MVGGGEGGVDGGEGWLTGTCPQLSAISKVNVRPNLHRLNTDSGFAVNV